MCNYKRLAQQTMDSMSAKLVHKNFAQLDKERVKERKEENDKTRDDFAKKFGVLKKASVLLFYGRANDAFDEVAKAAEIIKNQAEAKREQEQRTQQRW